MAMNSYIYIQIVAKKSSVPGQELSFFDISQIASTNKV
ncbi:hypothetical protein J2X61_000653 [Bacillus sp. 3255]|nr:hypothetical protein [Bacillus sp. 3255]